MRLVESFLVFFLLTSSSALAESWLCIDEENVGLTRRESGWDTSSSGTERWTLTLEGSAYRLTSFSLEAFKQNEEFKDLSYNCSEPYGSGVTVVCDGGMGMRFEFSPDTSRFVAFSRGLFYLIGADRPGSPGPSVSLGSCVLL